MADPDFTSLLDTEVEEAKRPPVIPQGTWTMMVKSYKEVTSSQKGTPGVEFTLVLQSPGDDVDIAALEAFSEKADITKRQMRHSFWVTDGALFMMREFIEHCGISHTGKTFKQVLPEVVGQAVKAYVNQTPSRRPGDDSVFNEITSFALAE